LSFNRFYAVRHNPASRRRGYDYDPGTDKNLVLLTHKALPSVTIAFDKNRWKIGIFFKLVNRHLRITRF
jgi:hypothetical protein